MSSGIEFSNADGLVFQSSTGYGRRKIIAAGSVSSGAISWVTYGGYTYGFKKVTYPAQSVVPMVFVRPHGLNTIFAAYGVDPNNYTFTAVSKTGFSLDISRLTTQGGAVGFDYIVYGDHSPALDNTGYGIQAYADDGSISFSSHDDAVRVPFVVQASRTVLATHTLPYSADWYILANSLGPWRWHDASGVGSIVTCKILSTTQIQTGWSPDYTPFVCMSADPGFTGPTPVGPVWMTFSDIPGVI